MKARIEKATEPLVGMPLWGCTRAADLASFQFGRRRTVAGYKSGPKQVGDYALHVECAWRISRADRVIVGNVDLYYPADLTIEVPLPDRGWDTGPNRRDELIRLLFEDGKREFMVRRVDVGSAGALTIVMDEGLLLEVLPNDSLSLEYWRLFRPSSDDEAHFVCTGRGIQS